MRVEVSSSSRAEDNRNTGRSSGRERRLMRSWFLALLVILCIVTAAAGQTQELLGELLKDTSKAIDIYSALRDPIRGSTRLFLEFYPLHHQDEEKDRPPLYAHQVIRGCVFSQHRNFSQTVEVPAPDVHTMAVDGNVYMDCATDEDFAFVKIQTLSGYVHPQAVKVATIQTERTGAVAACVAPLFSQRPDIHQWMHHYTQLGVNKFHMYVPTLHSHEAHHYDAPHEVWETVKGFNWRHGETHIDPFHLFEHPLAEWHHYSPSNRENYFGQVLVYNECLTRSRYSYDYVMFLDVDEFIQLNATTMGRKGPVSLPVFLRHIFPKRTASLEFVAYAYPKNCPATTVGGFVARHRIRDKTILKHHIKIMVRPKYVREVFVHFVTAVEDGWQEKLRVREDAAFLKHIVWIPPYRADCRAYVYEDTSKSPGE